MKRPTLKARLSIYEIGKFRFYLGTFVGFCLSVTLAFILKASFLFNNFGYVMSGEYLLNKPLNGLINYHSFTISLFSISLAFCFTTFLWTSKPFSNKRNKTSRLRMAHTNSLWMFFVCAMFFLRAYAVSSASTMGIQGDFINASLLAPVFIYLYCWNLISNVFVIWKMFFWTTIIVLGLALILSVT